MTPAGASPQSSFAGLLTRLELIAELVISVCERVYLCCMKGETSVQCRYLSSTYMYLFLVSPVAYQVSLLVALKVVLQAFETAF